MHTASIPDNGDTSAALVSGAQPEIPIQELFTRTESLVKVHPGFAPLPTLSRVEELPNALPVANIQSDIFIGKRKDRELFYFFHINNAATFKKVLKKDIIPQITSTQIILGPPEKQPAAYLNIAFSATGLAALGITDNIGQAFTEGQFADAPLLGDDLAIWESAYAGKGIHSVFLIGSDDQTHIDNLLNTITSAFGASITMSTTLQAVTRPGDEAGHEHFGYLDGVSNPTVIGLTHKEDVLPGQSILAPGIILAGRDGDSLAGQPARPTWTLDGSFLVFRKLQQFVPEFNQFCIDNALKIEGKTVEEGAALLGARMIGRWKSGAPTDLSPLEDDPELGKDPKRNNNFDFAHPGSSLNSDQSRCPFSAHIRKMRPRADLQNKNTINQAIRGGVTYGPEVTPSENETHETFYDRGLAFVEYQSQIELGFHVQQKTWANNPGFMPGKNVQPGFDPTIGQEGTSLQPVEATGLDPIAQSTQLAVPRYVKALGGEYFFTPSILALKEKISV